jgi:hypothetical protein
MKNAKSKLIAAFLSLAMALTTSCLEDSGNNSVSSTQKRLYCVYPNAEMCILGPFTEAQCASGMLMNECPFGTDNIFGGSPAGSPASSSSQQPSQNPSSNSNSITYPPATPATNFTFDNIQYWVGSGSNQAMFIAQWNDGKEPAALAWGYKWDGTKYGIDMVSDIVKTDNRFFLLTHSTGPMGNTIAGLGFDINGNKPIYLSNGGPPQAPVNGIVSTNVYDYDDWFCTDNAAHWKAGWYIGYWSYWVANDINNKWEYSNLGASSRELTNNSVDAWYFDNDMSSFSRCMGNENCSGRDFFGNITPR